MTEPVLWGIPLSLLFLYFLFYSFLGWAMETTFCSVQEKRFVARGFLYGPICPIYGAGVLMMVCWFAPFTGNPLLFYLVSTVCMSAWEYFVGWFLEVTTHIKYWDYSMYRFNLHGRICLWVCLMWGVLAYLVIFWVHPAVSALLLRIPLLPRYILCIVFLVLLLTDAALTIRELALLARMLGKLTQMADELQFQLSLGKAELSDRLDAAKERLAAAKESSDIRAAELRERYNLLLRKTARQTRHLRYTYSHMTSSRLSPALSAVFDAGRRAREERRSEKARKRKK